MRYRFFGLLLLVLFSSCERYLYRDRMMRIGPGFEYSDFSEIQETEYRIAPNDKISVRILTNDGAGMINISGGASGMVGGGTSLSVNIESDGFAKLPLFGRIYLAGLTIRQTEMLMEDRFSEFYNNPFVLVEVSNRRVMIFAGSNTRVVTLVNDNTTLFEVLAMSGGIPSQGKANKVKIVRGDLRNPSVYLVDLSTIQGIQNANLVLQANDIIYIETRNNYISKILSEFAPYLAILSSVVSTVAIVTRLQRIGQ